MTDKIKFYSSFFEVSFSKGLKGGDDGRQCYEGDRDLGRKKKTLRMFIGEAKNVRKTLGKRSWANLISLNCLSLR
jgi:hypothetical protein